MTKNCGVPSIGKINCTLMEKSNHRFSETQKDSLVTSRGLAQSSDRGEATYRLLGQMQQG
jgi:hypothetical protein